MPIRFSPLPLTLQYAFTDGACNVFAAALLTHPAGAGSRAFSLVVTDEKRNRDLDQPADFAEDLHTVLQDDRGLLIDAEGARTIEDLCRAFDVRPRKSRLVETKLPEAPPKYVEAIHALLDAFGWTSPIPRSEKMTVPMCVSAARKAFYTRATDLGLDIHGLDLPAFVRSYLPGCQKIPAELPHVLRLDEGACHAE